MIDDLKAILCDMDGTLISTYRANFLAYESAVKSHGLNLQEPLFRTTWGHDSQEFLPKLFPQIPLEAVDEIRNLKAEIYPDYFCETKLNSVLFWLLDSMRSQLKIGLVTTAKRRNVTALLAHYNLSDFFSVVVTGDDVLKSKPSPDAYLLATKALRADSTACIAIEDSDAGFQAAQAAGLMCLRIQSYEDF